MTMKLNLISIEREGFVRVASDGNITAGDFVPEAKNPMENLLGANWAAQRVLLNLDQTSYIDSSAIGWLIQCQKEFRTKGGGMVVHNVRPGVKQMLELLKIGRIVPMCDNELAAKTLLLNGGAK